MKTNHVVIVPYDPNWPQKFLEIKNEIENSIGHLIIGIEHVGSTAVKGMSAKPIIDIDVIIKDYSVFDEIVQLLSTIDYIYEGNLGIVNREAFKYNNKPHLQTHHLYVCPVFSKELHRHIKFRDYLKTNPEAIQKYSLIKEEAAKLYPNCIDQYINYKSACIEHFYHLLGL